MVLESPSPKFQSHVVGDPEDVSSNCTVRGAVPEMGDAVNVATSGVAVAVGVTVTVVFCVAVGVGVGVAVVGVDVGVAVVGVGVGVTATTTVLAMKTSIRHPMRRM